MLRVFKSLDSNGFVLSSGVHVWPKGIAIDTDIASGKEAMSYVGKTLEVSDDFTGVTLKATQHSFVDSRELAEAMLKTSELHASDIPEKASFKAPKAQPVEVAAPIAELAHEPAAQTSELMAEIAPKPSVELKFGKSKKKDADAAPAA